MMNDDTQPMQAVQAEPQQDVRNPWASAREQLHTARTVMGTDLRLSALLNAVEDIYEHLSPKQPQVVGRWRVEQIRFREAGVGYGFVRYGLDDDHPGTPWQAYLLPAGQDEAFEAWFTTQDAAMAAVDASADQLRAVRDAEVTS